MHYSTVFFDLDDTLYPGSNGLWSTIRDRMGLYMHERLGFPTEQVPAIRKQYYEKYGTTLRGLQIHHQVDADEYLAYVHDLPLRDYLQPAPGLRQMILSLPQQRWVFTNADADHARRVLAMLDLSGCFSGIIDIRALDFACKPELQAYQRALALAGSPSPVGCVLLDDSPANLAPAGQLGFTTVLVSANGSAQTTAGYSVPDPLALPTTLPQLWEVG
jgi:putative hydrolase of the HAD superfamily